MTTYSGERHGGHGEKAEHKRQPEGWLDKNLHGEASEPDELLLQLLGAGECFKVKL